MDILEKMTGNVSENTACWNAVESSIKSHGVDVPEGTPKSEYAEKVDAVYEAGKKAEYDAFWDALQQDGNRTDYRYAFGGIGWTADNFKPKYPIVATSAAYAFRSFNCDSVYENRFNRMDISNIKMDFSNVTNAEYLFNNARVENLFCDLSNATTVYYAFGSPNNGYVENITLRVSEKCTNCNLLFGYQNAIENIIFTDDSVIVASIDFRWSKFLNHNSIESTINALSGAVTDKTFTLSNTAVTNAFGSVDNAEWQALVSSKPNWTISLI